MIRARHSRPVIALFWLYVRWIFWRTFRGFELLNAPPSVDLARSLLLVANHTSWWDGFFGALLMRRCFPGEFSVLMREDELKKRPFLSLVGAFGVDATSPKSARELFRYLSLLLKKPSSRARVWLFPQGAITPHTYHPFVLKEGLRFVDCDENTPVLPVFFQVEYLSYRKPTVFVTFGGPLTMFEYKPHPDLLRERFEAVRKEAHDLLQRRAS